MEDLKELHQQLSEIKRKIKDSRKVDQKAVGERIKNLRRDHEMSQTELGDFMGLTRTNITNMEAGRSGLTINSLITLCVLFQVSSDYILGLENKK